MTNQNSKKLGIFGRKFREIILHFIVVLSIHLEDSSNVKGRYTGYNLYYNPES